MSTIINGRLKTTTKKTEVITKELEFELPCFLKIVDTYDVDYFYLTEEGGTRLKASTISSGSYLTITGGLYLFEDELDGAEPITQGEFLDAYITAHQKTFLPPIDKSKDDNVQIETIIQNKIDSAA